MQEKLLKASEVEMVVSGQTAGFPRCIISNTGSPFCTVTYIQVCFAAAVAEVEILSVRFVASSDGGPRCHTSFCRRGVEGRGLRFDTRLWDSTAPHLI